MGIVLCNQSTQGLYQSQVASGGTASCLRSFPIILDRPNSLGFAKLAQRLVFAPVKLFPDLNCLLLVFHGQGEILWIGLEQAYPLDFLLIEAEVTARARAAPTHVGREPEPRLVQNADDIGP